MFMAFLNMPILFHWRTQHPLTPTGSIILVCVTMILSNKLVNYIILDVFEYELWNPMALYASIPMMVRSAIIYYLSVNQSNWNGNSSIINHWKPHLFIQMSHSARGSVGLFWLNAAEGWVDVKKNGQVSISWKNILQSWFVWTFIYPIAPLFSKLIKYKPLLYLYPLI